MGAPIGWARDAQAWAGRAHMESTIKALEDYEFSERRGTTMVVKEPIGVCALITPWNWPLNQIVCKVAPALAAGCTVVLKPSEIAPISGIVFSEVMDAAGTPKGVYNMVNGTGPDVGQVMAGHPDVDMVSFTGSTRAGIIVAKTAADTVKRVSQELGGKSANIILPDADFERAVKKGVNAASATAASPATRRPACWCRRPATTRRSRSPRRRPKRTRSAIRAPRTPSSDRWSARSSSTRSRA